MLGVVWCCCALFAIINSQLVATQVTFTSLYNGSEVIGYLHSTVNFTWTYTGELRLADWGTKRSDGLTLDKKLVSFNQNGQVSLVVPSPYSGRVNGSWDGNIGQFTFTLTSIKEEDDNTIFICKLSPKNLLFNPVYDTVQLIVRDPAKAHLVNPTSKVEDARVGSSTSFTCNASGVPLPNVRWMRQSDSGVNEIAADNVKYQVTSGSGSSQLTIKDIAVGDEGYYICNASNYEFHLDRVFLGVISLYKSNDSCTSTKQSATVNVSSTICCPVRGFPPPDVIWEFPDGKQKTGNTILMITPKSKDDFGTYKCSAKGLKETEPDPVIITINLEEEEQIIPFRVMFGKKPSAIMWDPVNKTKEYLIRISGETIESYTILGGMEDNGTTAEILHSSLKFKNEKPLPSVMVEIEVLAVGENGIVGIGRLPGFPVKSAANNPGISFISVTVLFIMVLSLQ